MQGPISLKWMVELSWLKIRTFHRPDIQLMVCFLNSVSGMHFLLQWTRFWAVIQTLLCPTVEHLQLWSLIDTKSFTVGYRGEHREKDGMDGRLSGHSGLVPTDTLGERAIWLYNVAINTKLDTLWPLILLNNKIKH